MRLILTLVLTLFVLGQPFLLTLIYIQFRVNQDYIAKNLCEKKDVKDNSCHGCCQLKKQLRNTGEQPLKELPKSRTTRFEITYCNHFTGNELQIRYPLTLMQAFVSHDPGFKSSHYIGSIFHPPKQA